VSGDGQPVLSQYSFSNFNEKARWALDYKRVPHVRRSLLPGGLRALWLSRGDGTIPVLDLDGERIVDTTRIIEALERRYPRPPLYPKDPGERRRALELEDFFDEEAGHELRRAVFYEQLGNREYIATLLGTAQRPRGRRYVRAIGPIALIWARRRYRFYGADAEEGWRKVLAALDRIEVERGGGDYLVGDSFTVADLAAAALLFPLAWPPELQYDYPEPPPSRLLDQVAVHPAVAWIREIYRRHRGASAEMR
jgi:glutathione S-transferase